jgi:hypothetical protein
MKSQSKIGHPHSFLGLGAGLLAIRRSVHHLRVRLRRVLRLPH